MCVCKNWVVNIVIILVNSLNNFHSHGGRTFPLDYWLYENLGKLCSCEKLHL